MKKLTMICAMLAMMGISNTACGQAPQTDSFETKKGDEVVITTIKHASMRIAYNGLEIQVDPVTNQNPKTDYTAFPKADFILVTHEHGDHCDRQAVRDLQKMTTRIIANHNAASILGQGDVMKNGDDLKLTDHIKIEAVPAYNYSSEKLNFHPQGRDNGYVLTIDGLRIYIAGDTEDIPEMKGLKNIDVAFLPCNLPYTMTPEQVAKAAKMIKPKVLFPYHYGQTKIEEVSRLLEGSGIDVRIRNYQ